jgi:hypothetical protein
LSVLDPGLVKQIAAELGARPDLVEKDWHVVRAIGVLAECKDDTAQPVFCGGTSLSIGWGILKRFSEDIDFKVTMPDVPTSAARAQRRAYREKLITALAGADFQLIGEPKVRNESPFFTAEFTYGSQFERGPGLRPHIQLEMTFEPPTLPPIARPIQSLIGRAQQQAPEIAAFLCVDPVETATEKLSALAWRVCERERGEERDDPRIIRHLHDLAALMPHVGTAPKFATLLHQTLILDSDRGKGRAPADPQERLTAILDRLNSDKLWGREYDEYVESVSYAPTSERISFAAALVLLTQLATGARQ